MPKNQIKTIPLLPLRGLLVYPSVVLHLDVGRDKSVEALEKVMLDDQKIFLVAQKEMATEDPGPDDIYKIGTISTVKQMLKLPNGTFRILAEGEHRGRIQSYSNTDGFFEANVEIIEEDQTIDLETEALMRSTLDQFSNYINLSRKITAETLATVQDIEEPGRLADVIAYHLPLKNKEKQKLLETLDIKERLRELIGILSNEQEVLGLEQKIGQRVKKSMERTQKEYYLREQMKAIQKELGDKETKEDEIGSLREKIEGSAMPEKVKETALKELARYEKIPQSSAESGVIRNYIDWLLQLPWDHETEDNLDIRHAEETMNKAHYGLDKVKERVLEYLSVQTLTKSLNGPILCLVGPPGVGKTSLARSVAESLNRHFVRISLGGVRDEAEIRGHRRTYVGAMPGRIIQGMKKAGTINPVFLLDEIDKMSNDFRGDPAAALLEVLDPEQNNVFSDHYIEEPYDLSKVMFITTANNAQTIPGPLLDRMELLSIAGYTELEKLHIAMEHLIPKQVKKHGLKKNQFRVKEEAVLFLIRSYTREAGVRSLERAVASLCRKVAKLIVTGEKKSVTLTSKMIEKLLGKPTFRQNEAETEDQVGVATGLAYTPYGGTTLFIEVSTSKGKGRLTLTGKLGDVMKESAQAALSYVRSRADDLNISANFSETTDIHIHVPEGATPKDGPSAGITMATAIVSALTGRPVKKEVGMTGEITLRGRVLPIGGLKEKTLSAHRAGLKTIIIPKDNENDLEDIPESVRKELTFIKASHLDEVLKHALGGEKIESEKL
ncbi:ATP-dependent Lon protease [Pullulanibacillus pueri]|uniref:Lon protease n=1 Tax=Pullulanibacillus pueri TaxID=1437324 RepID=A0A8J2ZX12_9BACL|nr:endopeptidase La [Pullulanibacillus pueri]MBM7681910.1 ATP-dependent Lon protease [Pullulanibacillus pueri]GGH83408.1 Lon protease [Pullulanibacillus pueri]